MEQIVELPAHTVRALGYLHEVAKLVAAKGLMYGDSLQSAFAGTLTGLDGPTGILARIEDKLGRYASLRARGVSDTEDTIADIIGYFALLATWQEPPDPDALANVIDLVPFLNGSGSSGNGAPS